MVGTNACKTDHLCKLLEHSSESLRGEGGTIVRNEGLWHHSMVAAHQFKLLLRLQRLMCIQVLLELNMKVTSCMVGKHASTTVHLTLARSSSRREQTTFGTAHKVVDGDLLSSKQVVLLQYSRTVLYYT
jgi:hypothetical protein